MPQAGRSAAGSIGHVSEADGHERRLQVRGSGTQVSKASLRGRAVYREAGEIASGGTGLGYSWFSLWQSAKGRETPNGAGYGLAALRGRAEGGAVAVFRVAGVGLAGVAACVLAVWGLASGQQLELATSFPLLVAGIALIYAALNRARALRERGRR